MNMELTFENIITTEDQLRDIMGHPNEVVNRKTIDHIDDHCRSFIEQSPFITIATSDLEGNFDVSPKGDPAGFVKILNDKTLAIPDRPGNRKADSLRNIIHNPNIGMLFMIPGVRETLRVNGSAKVVTDAHILEQLSCQGKQPDFAIIVDVQEAFMHCAKCMIRSKLWESTDDNKEAVVPSLGKMLVDHAKLDMDYKVLDGLIEENEKAELY